MNKAKWIPCSERLPEETGYYMITCYYSLKREVSKKLRRLAICHYDSEVKVWDYGKLMTVVAWMDGLPEIYMGDIK